MNFQELIRKRCSVRAYGPRPVEEEKLARVLEAARLAPTACNRQPFRVIVIPTGGREDELRRIYGREWFVQAPLVLAVCALPAESWVGRFDGWNAAEVDATIAMDHLILAATEEGLGTCWIAAFEPEGGPRRPRPARRRRPRRLHPARLSGRFPVSEKAEDAGGPRPPRSLVKPAPAA